MTEPPVSRYHRVIMITFAVDQSSFDNLYKALGTLGAIGTFLWTVYTWREKSRNELAASAADAERSNRARIIEATKPFLERQLELYTVVTRAASMIATSDDEKTVQQAIGAFLQLYSGELALVQNEEVAVAMQNYRRALQDLETRPAAPGDEAAPQNLPVNADDQRQALQQLSLNLASACRKSLAKSWHVDAWANPDHAA
jgi:hypothetical protein